MVRAFFEYQHDRGEPMTVLVIENKDTVHVQEADARVGQKYIEGTTVNVLLNGEGNKITKKGALEDYNAIMLVGQGGQSGADGQVARFLYFGDLDWVGIRLFFRTREANPSLELTLFSSLYRLMLELAATINCQNCLINYQVGETHNRMKRGLDGVISVMTPMCLL